MDIDRWFEELDVDRSESLESAEVARSRLLGPPPHSVPLCAEQAHVSFPGRLHDLIFLRRAGHAQVRQLMMELDVANHGHVHRREFEEWYTTQVRNEESERGAQRGAPR